MRPPIILINRLAQLLEGVVGAEDAHVDVVLEVVAVVDVQPVVEDVERRVVEDFLRVGDVVVDGFGLLLSAFPGGETRDEGLVGKSGGSIAYGAWYHAGTKIHIIFNDSHPNT